MAEEDEEKLEKWQAGRDKEGAAGFKFNGGSPVPLDHFLSFRCRPAGGSSTVLRDEPYTGFFTLGLDCGYEESFSTTRHDGRFHLISQ